MGGSIDNGQLAMDNGAEVAGRAQAIFDGLMERCPVLKAPEVRALADFFADAEELSLLTPEKVVTRVTSVALQQYVQLSFLSPRVQMHKKNTAETAVPHSSEEPLVDGFYVTQHWDDCASRLRFDDAREAYEAMSEAEEGDEGRVTLSVVKDGVEEVVAAAILS